MKILKFGGSSLKNSECVKNAIDIIIGAKKDRADIVVVVSALSGITDNLITLATIASRGASYNKILEQLELRHKRMIRDLITDTQKQEQNYAITMVTTLIHELDTILDNVFNMGNLSLKDLDLIMSFGERFLALIISEALKSRGVSAQELDAREVIITDENFGRAVVDYKKTYQNIRNYCNTCAFIPVVTGFIASSQKGNTTTLGRGGSDYTAALFGAALDADEIQIWTDVDGVMSADPKKVINARSIERMNYEEAMEMSYFGANVLYPLTILPAQDKNIPIRIKNSFNPDFDGTMISNMPSRTRITGISSIENIALLRVQGSGMIGVVGIAKRVFSALAQNNISVILISQASSEHSICCALESQNAYKAKKAIEKEFVYEIRHHLIDKVVIEEDVLIIAVVGENMRKTPGVCGKLFHALGNKDINVVAIAQGSSERNISTVINKHNEAEALNTIHNAFFPQRHTSTLMPPAVKTPSIPNIFMIGTGNIGSSLISQIQKSPYQGNIMGLGNSRNMIFDTNGIFLPRWGALLEKGDKMNIDEFVKKMKNKAGKRATVLYRNLKNSYTEKGAGKRSFPVAETGSERSERPPEPRGSGEHSSQAKRATVFVDCTASKDVVRYYNDILASGISIVTPNKIANSGTYAEYEKLRQTAYKNNVLFLYETNVGAGLPIINTINALISSGDEIVKIEAILSGTLSYIFNCFSAGKLISEIVKSAKEKGYTEPDPRDDLNGMDVARKALILAREIGWQLELEHIMIENLIPHTLRKIRSVDAFLKRLDEIDPHFEHKQKQAEDKRKALRYIARLENKKVCVSLQSVDEKHPFYNMDGNDNIVSITSKYYNDRPLVIKGPGAGKEVTAAGVLRDIIRASG